MNRMNFEQQESGEGTEEGTNDVSEGQRRRLIH